MKAEIGANKAFRHLRHPEAGIRYYVERGGAGSGKSWAAAQAVILSCLSDGNRRWLVVRKVRATIRHSVYDLLTYLIKSMNLSGLVAINRSEFTFTFWNGAMIICTGLDDAEKIKSIHEITNIWEEEATELTESDHRQLDLRMRGRGIDHWGILTFNPVSSLSWIKKAFFDTRSSRVELHHSTYRDNWYIDEAYKEQLESLEEVDPYFYQVYTLGEWGVLGNRVFNNIAVEDFEYGENELESISEGMDFGFNHASVVERVGWKDGELYVFDEFYAKGITNTELIDQVLGELLPNDWEGTLIAGSAEPDRIKEFNQALSRLNMGGTVIGAKKGKDSVRMGIDFLKRHKVHVNKSRCPNLAREMIAYKWREDKDGQPMDEPVPFNDDTIAALRYAVEDLWATTQRFTVLTGTELWEEQA